MQYTHRVLDNQSLSLHTISSMLPSGQPAWGAQGASSNRYIPPTHVEERTIP